MKGRLGMKAKKMKRYGRRRENTKEMEEYEGDIGRRHRWKKAREVVRQKGWKTMEKEGKEMQGGNEDGKRWKRLKEERNNERRKKTERKKQRHCKLKIKEKEWENQT